MQGPGLAVRSSSTFPLSHPIFPGSCQNLFSVIGMNLFKNRFMPDRPNPWGRMKTEPLQLAEASLTQVIPPAFGIDIEKLHIFHAQNILLCLSGWKTIRRINRKGMMTRVAGAIARKGLPSLSVPVAAAAVAAAFSACCPCSWACSAERTSCSYCSSGE
jgi:hypothetical protein